MIGNLRVRISNSVDLGKIIANSGWLFADKVVRMGMGLLVGAWVARYLGPERFGLWSFAIALVSLVSSVSGLGLNELLVRDLVAAPVDRPKLLGTAFWLKCAAGVATIGIAVLVAQRARVASPLFLTIVLLTAVSSFFQAFDVIELHFQSLLKARFPVIARSVAFVVASGLKIVFILRAMPLIYFAWTAVVEAVLAVGLLIYFYSRTSQHIRQWSWNHPLAKKLLGSSWPLILSSLVIMVYMRIDQVMLGQMLGTKAVGEFSAAVRLSEFWYFVPVAITSSFFPSIVQLRSQDPRAYLRRLQSVLDLVTLASLLIALLTTVAAPVIIRVLYGAQYHGAAQVLALHIWAGVFVFLGVAGSQWFIVENLQKFSFYRALSGAVINVLLNIVLIPKFGPAGCALATLVSQAVASYFANAVSRQTSPLFKMQTMALWNAMTLRPILSLRGSHADE